MISDKLASDFHAEHERPYDYGSQADTVGLVNVSVLARVAFGGSRQWNSAMLQEGRMSEGDAVAPTSGGSMGS